MMEHFYTDIPGYATDTLRYIYRRMVELANHSSRFVELGAFYGNSAAFMAVEIINSGKNIKFDVVDTFRGSQEHQQGKGAEDPIIAEYGNLAGEYVKYMTPVQHIVRTLVMTTVQAVDFYQDESIDFLFHDASHQYDDVIKDFEIWYPKIKHGGVIGGHDAQLPGVKKAAREFFGDYQEIGDSWLRSKE